MRQIGVIIIIIGLALTFFTAFTYFTREKVVDLGSLEITQETPHTMSWSPVIGIALLGLGGVILWRTFKK